MGSLVAVTDPPCAAGIAADPTLVTVSVTGAESNVDENKISKLF